MAHGNETTTNGTNGQSLPATPLARPDLDRMARRGIPEVILAEAKSVEGVIDIARQFLANTGRALISRLPDTMFPQVVAAFPHAESLHYPLAHALRLTTPDTPPPPLGGHIGLISAGTSDIPYADEARFMAESMGTRVTCIFDVGVAGVHRLFEPLNALITAGADAAVVAAGMDGALPSLVAGLVPFPVIGLPTPIGYGMGGQGEGALLAMLQSCTPGLVVQNIGNGIGAGAVAALIANRVAQARHASAPDATAGQFAEAVVN